jgi:transposase
MELIGTFFIFLKQLRRISCYLGRGVVLIANNARYHHGLFHKEWRQSCSDRFNVEFFTPYSPELNPIERIWKLTRRLAIHNRYFPSLTDVEQAVEKVFLKWKNGNDTLRRLYAIK